MRQFLYYITKYWHWEPIITKILMVISLPKVTYYSEWYLVVFEILSHVVENEYEDGP